MERCCSSACSRSRRTCSGDGEGDPERRERGESDGVRGGERADSPPVAVREKHEERSTGRPEQEGEGAAVAAGEGEGEGEGEGAEDAAGVADSRSRDAAAGLLAVGRQHLL